MDFHKRTGTVLRLCQGFGFLAMYQGPDVFFLPTELKGGLYMEEKLIGRRVEFDLREGPRGLVAVNIHPAAEPARPGR